MSNRPRRVNPQPARIQARAAADPSTRRRLLIWGALGAVVLVAVIVGVAVAQSSSDDGSGIETGFAETIGDALPVYDGSGNAVGLPAPLIRAQDNQSGDVVEVRPDDGTVRVIGFFAHWCPHCQDEVPRVTGWLADNDLPAGVEIVAVSTSVDAGAPNYPPSAWFEREGWPTPVLVDTDQSNLYSAYGQGGFPYWVVVDGDGLVVERSSGELDEARFAAMIDRAAASVAR